MLEVANITKRYESLEALKDVSLGVSKGEILAVLGPSGCGKTTLLRLVAGFEIPDEGRILIEGDEVSTPTRAIPPSKRKLSMIFQDLALWPHMSVGQHIDFVMHKENKTSVLPFSDLDTILKQINLAGYRDRYPHQLSGGEKQRLAIARALASNPTYLLMDEPFSNLDSILKDELQELVIELMANDQMGIIYVTHNVDEALVLADRIAIMKGGRLEQIDTKAKVLNEPKNEFVRRLMRIREFAL